MRHLLSHQAGLPAFPESALEVEYDDRQTLVDLLAEAAPVHPPGAGVAEHALTYGHLLDEVLRRLTRVTRRAVRPDRGRAGGPAPARQARPDQGGTGAVDADAGTQLQIQHLGAGPDLGAGLLDPEVLNSPRFRATPFPAVALHATALALARFYDDVIRPDGLVATRLGHGLWRAYVEPAAGGRDLVLNRPVTWTLGFQVSEENGRVEAWDGRGGRLLGLGRAGRGPGGRIPDQGAGWPRPGRAGVGGRHSRLPTSTAVDR